MAAMIVAEIWDEKTGKYKTEASFSSVDEFIAHAKKFREKNAEEIMRVHIPGGFNLSATDSKKISDLGVERI